MVQLSRRRREWAEMSKETRAAAGANATTDDEVRRNEFGGVYVDEEELKAAFDFFDVGKKGTLTPADLKQRLGVFYKNLPAREYKFLISEPDFNFNTLKKLLVNNELRFVSLLHPCVCTRAFSPKAFPPYTATLTP